MQTILMDRAQNKNNTKKAQKIKIFLIIGYTAFTPGVLSEFFQPDKITQQQNN